jgi:hypothetical protein
MLYKSLYEQTISDLKLEDIHPFHHAILEECCENAVIHAHDITNTTTLSQHVNVAFLSSITMLQQTLKAAFVNNNSLSITYRNREFILKQDIVLLTQFLEHMVKMAMDNCVEIDIPKKTTTAEKLFNFKRNPAFSKYNIL